MLDLLHLRGQFLFQVKPSLFPEGELTGTEVLLWDIFYSDRKKRLDDINGS